MPTTAGVTASHDSILRPRARRSTLVGIELLIRVEERKRNEFLQAAQALCRQMLREGGEGLLTCGAFEDLSDSGRFLWIEHWRDRSELETHLGSDEHRALLGAIRVLGTLEGKQLVEYAGTGTRGTSL